VEDDEQVSFEEQRVGVGEEGKVEERLKRMSSLDCEEAEVVTTCFQAL
jgi:hypothetical protein